MRPYVRIEGMSQLRRALLMVGEEGAKAVRREVRRAAYATQRVAKEKCPVDTGRLRNSIAVEFEDDGFGVTGVVGTNVEYAPFVEFGTRFQVAQPFLFSAWEEEKIDFVAGLRRELGAAFVKASDG